MNNNNPPKKNIDLSSLKKYFELIKNLFCDKISKRKIELTSLFSRTKLSKKNEMIKPSEKVNFL